MCGNRCIKSSFEGMASGNRSGVQRPTANGAGGTAGQGKICQFKLVLLGESAVGKSSLVLRFVKGQFHEYQESTIGGESSKINVSTKYQQSHDTDE